MTDIVQDVEAQSKLRFPKWGPREQEFWMDMFSNYSQALLPGESVEDTERAGFFDVEITPEIEQRFVKRVEVAARLADAAVQEMLYRFYVHQKRTKRRAARR